MRLSKAPGRAFLTAVLALLLLAASCAAPPVVPDEERIVTRPDARAVVIVHSKTAHTARMGRQIADAVGADFVWLKTGEDAHGDPVVSPATVDLARYRLVFLGSPIWYGLQTKFMNAFTDRNDLSGKSVVLFNTYGGHVRDDFPGLWIQRVIQAHGTVIDHFAVVRAGRTDEQVQTEIAGLIARRIDTWKAILNEGSLAPEE